MHPRDTSAETVTWVAAFAIVTGFAVWGERLVAGTDSDDPVIVVVTLDEQPALDVVGGLPRPDAALTGEDRDATDAVFTREALRRIAALLGPAQDRVRRAIEARGGSVLHVLQGYGAAVARVPRRATAELERLPGVLSVELETQYRLSAEGATAPVAMPASWPHAMQNGAVDLAVVDTGIRIGLAAFDRRALSVSSQIFHNSARLQRDYSDDYLDPDDHQGHGTSVSGVVFTWGLDLLPPYPGISYGIDRFYNLKAAYRARDGASHATQGDVMTAIDTSLGFEDPPEVINYSYGSDAVVDDDGYCRFFDNVVDAFGRVMTISAGNAGLRAIGTPGIAYNVISVANVNDRGTPSRHDDAIAATSSAGPTPGGRKKPDLAAPGSRVPTTSLKGGIEQVTGTSYSAPAIAAAAAQLVDGGTTDPRAVKAVLINSADDFGLPGWDIDFGWGYFSAERTQHRRRDYVLGELRGDRAGRRRFYARRAADETKATLVWHRHMTRPGEGHARGAYLNDLDLYLYDGTRGAMRDASVSGLDNVEQVGWTGREPALLVVETTGPLVGAPERFALAHSGGFVECAGPDVAVDLKVRPGTAGPGSLTLTATVRNTGDVRGHAYEATVQVPEGYGLVGPAAQVVLGSLDPGEAVVATWQVQALSGASSITPAPPPTPVVVRAGTLSYGWTWQSEARVPLVSPLATH